MRTRQCKLIGRAVCCAAVPVRIGVQGGWVTLPALGASLEVATDLDAFAKADGFAGWAEMTAFWRKEHPEMDVFSGILIQWEGLTA